MLRNLNQSSGGRRILGVPQVGILAATIASQTATGDHGPGLLYDESINPVNAGKQLRLVVTSPPSAGVFFSYENGSFDFSGAPDGSYSIGYNVLADNALIGSDTATVVVGAVSATAPGATLTGTSSLSAGTASGQQNATAPGATLTGSSSISAGTATGGASGDATAPGVTLSGTSIISAGSATGNQDATAPGATLTGSSSIAAGAASNGSYTRAPSGSGPSLIYPKTKRGASLGRCRH
jgi:hypothetical protein